ncbi:hypothetical protein [Pseudaestuariivita rosea]|uniref:hypothetical protein n=1 Tax=Pseudaestuariivita rosea TaxID=2763263 RepID=UPI001ABBCA2C|nr:hypothetical protein [Pseudaestuariivita rosea]
MSEIEELQGRITAALARIDQGLDRMTAPVGQSNAELEKSLADEKAANAKLTEELKLLRKAMAKLESQADAAQPPSNAVFEIELRKLTEVNAVLRKNNEALRKANSPDAELVHASLHNELKALRAARAADRAELDAVLAQLKTMIEESA